MKSRRDRIRDHYEPRIVPGRSNYRVLDWASHKSQHARFAVLADNLDLEGKSLLDVGSGLGDLWAYLHGRGTDLDYVGVDLVGEMVDRARELHPGVRFECADIFENCPFQPESFDVVFCSGMFNLKLGNNREFLQVAAGRFLELAREHAVFNLLHRRAGWSFGRYFYFKPAWVMEMLGQFPCRARLIEDYLYNDFTVICEKRPGVG